MSNIIGITTFSNDDLLYIYLEQLSKSPIVNKYKINLFTEPGYNTGIDNVISKFSFLNLSLKVRERVNCPMVGFHNLLRSYDECAEECDEFFILGEDDLLPSLNYLEYCEEVYNKFLSKLDRVFCCAHKRRGESELDGSPNMLIGDYQLTSPGCIRKDIWIKYVRPYLCNDLFNNPSQFYVDNFSNIRIHPFEHMHWDGCLDKISTKHELFTIKPDKARTCHVGLRGIHSKGSAPQGNLEKRVSQWKELIKNPEKLRSLSITPTDIVSINLDENIPFKNLKLDLERNQSLSSPIWYDVNNNFKDYVVNEKI